MKDPEAAKIIDELICLWAFGEKRRFADLDYNVVDQGIHYIIQTRVEHPELPISVALFIEMQKRGLLV